MLRIFFCFLSVGCQSDFLSTKGEKDEKGEWSVKDVEGRSVSLSDFRGQTVVLNFWATWCGPCRTEIPAFSAFSKENPDIPVLGISVDDASPKAIKRAAKSLGITYPVLIATPQMQKQYNVSSLPMTVIVDVTGQVKDVHIGMMLKSQLDLAVKQ